MKWLAVILLSVSILVKGECQAQQSKDPLVSIIYLQSGDRFVGMILEEGDSSILLDEWYIGKTEIKRHRITKIMSYYRNDLIRFTLTNQAKFSGHVIDVKDGSYVVDVHDVGERLIPIQSVAELETIPEAVLTGYNPNSTRYFFAPSAIPIKRGGGYYQNAYLLANSVNFGLTDRFTLGGGVVIPLLFYATPKFGVQVGDKAYLGAGLLAATTFIPDAIFTGGIPFAAFTAGDGQSNFTLAAGYGIMWDDEGEFVHTTYPIGTINGITRISRRIQLVTENWFIPLEVNHYEDIVDQYGQLVEERKTGSTEEVYMAISLGMRFEVGDRSTVDFAPVYLRAEEGLVIPYLDFVYQFR